MKGGGVYGSDGYVERGIWEARERGREMLAMQEEEEVGAA